MHKECLLLIGLLFFITPFSSSFASSESQDTGDKEEQLLLRYQRQQGHISN